MLTPKEITGFLQTFHRNVDNNIEDMRRCYKGLSKYLPALQHVFRHETALMKRTVRGMTFRESWCHFKQSSVRTRVRMAKNQQQILLNGANCQPSKEKIQRNKLYLSEIPNRHFRRNKSRRAKRWLALPSTPPPSATPSPR